MAVNFTDFAVIFQEILELFDGFFGNIVATLEKLIV